MDTYLETIFTAVSWNWGEVFSTEILSNLQTEKNDHAGEFYQGFICGCSFKNWIVTGWLHGNLRICRDKVLLTQKETV